MKSFDLVVIGAGGAGLFCAARAAERGFSVVALDHADKLGKKILVSGGGRCNFTNIHASPKNYVSQNEHFIKSALSRFSPQDFLAYIERHKIPYFEKKLGQLFCKDSAKLIVNMLETECKNHGAEICLNTKIIDVQKNEFFTITTENETYQAKNLVIATGGIS
ncbi:MAG: NAD(P)/FAD-dependent oxidoreductase, partial [Oligoflexia bacterium]|nr:NAD(P)/FAD-dependent oxidoreductase [Oligoflexia bacterium]